MSKYRIMLDGKTYEMEVELVDESSTAGPAARGDYKEFRTPVKDSAVRVIDPSAVKMTTSHKGVVESPMPGTIIAVKKAEGDEVKTGDVVLILEAMKMENEISAPVDGRIIRLNVAANSTVAGGDVLFEIQ